MGPFQSNCYVVRAERGAAEAAVIDPGDDPTAAPARARSAWARAPAASSSRTPTSTTSAASRRSPTAPARGLGAERRGRGAAQPGETRGGLHVAPARPEHAVTGGDEITVAGITFDVVDVPGHSAGHVAFFADGHLFSGDLLFAGSVGRVDLPGGDWETLLDSVRALVDRFPGDTIVHPGHGPATTLERELQTNPFLRDLRTEQHVTGEPVPGAARDTRRPAGRRQLVGLVARMEETTRALRVAAHPDAGLRGHGPLRAHVRRSVRRRAQGDVHVRGSKRPLADAAPRGHRADRARVRRARPAPRPAAREGVHDRADVPLRPPGRGRYREHYQVSVEAIGSRRPRDRRRGDRGVHRDPAPARRDAVGAAPQLDRRRRLPARSTSSA